MRWELWRIAFPSTTWTRLSMSCLLVSMKAIAITPTTAKMARAMRDSVRTAVLPKVRGRRPSRRFGDRQASQHLRAHGPTKAHAGLTNGANRALRAPYRSGQFRSCAILL
jgi:hypothetical protein